MPAEVLTKRALNRTLLRRQLLLERVRMPVAAAIEHLVGMQSQVPSDPYFGLWSRLEGFDPGELSELVASGKAVRTWLMRGTIHLVTARDASALHPFTYSVLAKAFESTPFARNIAGVDRDELLARARQLLSERPMTRMQLGRALAEHWPGAPPGSLGAAATYLVPVAQIPPRGTWGARHQATLTLLDQYLREPLGEGQDPAEVVRRYLRAYGPAAPKDVRAWSYKTGLRGVIDHLRSALRTYRTEDGSELLDIPDGEFADPDTPAPVRFLPEYDNALLAHEDRSRINPAGNMNRLWLKGSVLVDGFVDGTWRLDRGKTATTLLVEPWSEWSTDDREAVADEADLLLQFATAGEGAGGVRITTT